MIPLILQNANVFIWNSEDWKNVRLQHRIIGNLFGCLPRAPYQSNCNGLPCALLDEEVALLLEKKICKLVTYKSLTPSAKVESDFKEYKTKSKAEQEEYVIAERKRSISSMIDRIVEGKKKKLNSKNTCNSKTVVDLDRENVLRAELDRVEQTPLTHTLIHTFCEDPWLVEDNFVEVTDWNYPHTEKESIRYQIFKDLWEKGYYVTCGQKFGGDFLVYPGDPALYHAHYIVLCKGANEQTPLLDIATHCRVSSSARKTFVLASVKAQSSPSYASLQFESLSRCPT